MAAWKGRRALILMACVGTIGCDRVTKHAAATMLAGGAQRSWLGDTIRLSYAENAGGFLSLGADLPVESRTVVFTALTGLLLLGLTIVAVRSRWQGARLLGAAMIAAGGASNWIDRLATGFVVDFMNVGLGPLRTGIFNVADMAIMAGVALMVVAGPAGNGSRRDVPQ